MKKQGETRHIDGKWKEGVSGNPKGRPPGSISLVKILKDKLEEVPKGQKKTYAEQIVQKWITQALYENDSNLLKEMVRYTDGMPAQAVDVTSNGEKLQISFAIPRPNEEE